ncbi:sugar phosphate isomerase/epimerase family protein [Rossellomorea marisflavi]|uniref:sugar phosphate isomerase/epimerase family protein n=1 Tax=Rossellomorea marisflavi TaxID=189381 RepID=UPI0034578993
MRKIPVALQLYTLREEVKKDFKGTLRKVAEMGFDGVELAGHGGLDILEVKEALQSCGLQAISSHVPLADLRNDLEKVLEDQLELGVKFIVCPYLTEEERDYALLISDLNAIGERCHEAGLTLCYHHHDFEVLTEYNGRPALASILEETNVQAELDLYWLTYAGEDPAKWTERYHPPLVHLKDMTTDEERFFAELGTGGVDLESAFALGKSANIQWWIVEQDASKTSPIESVRKSMDYLKQMGLA